MARIYFRFSSLFIGLVVICLAMYQPFMSSWRIIERLFSPMPPAIAYLFVGILLFYLLCTAFLITCYQLFPTGWTARVVRGILYVSMSSLLVIYWIFLQQDDWLKNWSTWAVERLLFVAFVAFYFLVLGIFLRYSLFHRMEKKMVYAGGTASVLVIFVLLVLPSL